MWLKNQLRFDKNLGRLFRHQPVKLERSVKPTDAPRFRLDSQMKNLPFIYAQ